MAFGGAVRWYTTRGEPVTARGVTVTPQARVLVVRLPFGGFVWNRPSAVLVEQDGEKQRLRIGDRTRLLQLALLGWTLVAAVAVWRGTSRRKEQRS